ncbi:type I-C CRISPR-associated protein Cas8c/Csd1 [Methanosarcina mazei]|jgi:CRISPR-associated protein Csd1|uniref:CRISPR-associated protein Csd1 n=1 Tax=Methanosarcina mazei TaxID=2209 RepID=A0A0F8I5B5_METMZ|nr:type I-C CRISPR-associated protein Cas8c/Csd1 [Methanosarcina mazei]KKG69161.1 CRISPR-associated protein Csd1 [Methanosarcina mazei]KKG84141.1 CRISPR-associated protein Csd1 [Methanosarcina mazei]KKH12503.1 CRISPR-associated protein Csd1 [Methanosarcina mazei]KKH12774.1 CRISPR-associated protein Csd1 [Methanosarcina mazei]
MIIQSLCRHYDVLEGDENVNIPKIGYSNAKVSFALVITPDGFLSHIVDLRSDDKKPKPKDMDVPIQKSRASGVFPYFVCDNAKYVFGVEKVKRSEFEKKFNLASSEENSVEHTVLEENDKEVTLVHRRSRECFETFKTLHHSILDGLDDQEVRGFLAFLDGWNPEEFLENPKTREYKDDLLAGGNCVFECDGNFLHQKSAVRNAWETYSQNETDNTFSQCLISGKVEPVAKIHQKIKGVVGAQSAGASIVSFNNDAFCSYGKKQSFNSPISEYAMFKYTTALNHLLSSQSNRIRIADTTVVFWAETSEKSCEELVKFFFDPPEPEKKEEKNIEGSRVQDITRIKEIEGILNKIRIGKKVNQEDIGTDPETNFYILGLSPNNARLAVRFWYIDSIGNLIEKVARHHLDMEIIRDYYGPRCISIYRLLNETVPQSSDKKTVSPLLGGLILRSILTGTGYPISLYNAILSRVKVDGSINFVRAGFIKAYLLRLSRAGLSNLNQDLITMSLNEESLSVPYRLGRLFAALEKAQNDTNREMKSTINSKYFSSASSTPAVVFPVLLKLAQHHIAKSEWGFRSNQLIEQILAGVDEFPAYLNLEDQGMFMLGYYHQRKAFFTKKEVPLNEEVSL